MEFESDVLRRLRAEAPGPDGATRVVFLGSSQTWGRPLALVLECLARRTPPGAVSAP